ncbi:MAG: pseudouridine synthase [Rikenellaceae bacterium]
MSTTTRRSFFRRDDAHATQPTEQKPVREPRKTASEEPSKAFRSPKVEREPRTERAEKTFDRAPRAPREPREERPMRVKRSERGAKREESRGAKPVAKIGERPFEKFRKDSPVAQKKQERNKVFEGAKFTGKSDTYNERVAVDRTDRKSGRTKREEKILETAAKQTIKTNEPIRLNRFVAQSGVCSRREADELISQGLVSVNGEVVTQLGSKVSFQDVIEYDGKVLRGEQKIYIVMNKPKGYITSLDDPHNDRTVIDLLKGQVPQRVYPVGRLDKNTTGVLLLTNDGDLTKELTHPSYNKSKIYHVFLDKSCSEAHLEQLLDGVELEDGRISVDQISFVGGAHKEIGVELHSGRNRIVRRMFEHLGYEVQKLDRVYFAGLTKLGLRRGFWRILSDKEVAALKNRNYK